MATPSTSAPSAAPTPGSGTPTVLNLGKNVSGRVEGRTLILEIDLDQIVGPSKSGNSTIIATTSGNVQVGATGGTLGLNFYRK